MKLRNKIFAASAALAISGLFTMNNQEVEAAWAPRTVSEIKEDIETVKENQEDSDAVEYSFKDGDTLWGISEATGIPVSALTQVNEINNRHLIFVGNSIYLSENNSVISVKDENNEVKSYDVTSEVKETETPKEVTEKSQESKVSQESQDTAAAVTKEETATVEAPAKQEEPKAETTANQTEEQTPAQNTSSSTGSLIGTFNATAYAIGDGLTPSTVTANGTNVANTIYSGGHRIIAVDTSVIPMNSVVEVHIPGWEPFTAVAADTGGAINGNKIDLLVGSPSEASNFGVRGGIKIYRVN